MERALVYVVAIGWLSAEAYSLVDGLTIGALIIILGFVVEEMTEELTES
jgi:hypothetical protein